MKKFTTVITNAGFFIEVKNPRLMSVEETMKYEELEGSPVKQLLHVFECCLMNKSDMKLLNDLSLDEVGGLLQQMVIDFSSDRD